MSQDEAPMIPLRTIVPQVKPPSEYQPRTFVGGRAANTEPDYEPPPPRYDTGWNDPDTLRQKRLDDIMIGAFLGCFFGPIVLFVGLFIWWFS